MHLKNFRQTQLQFTCVKFKEDSITIYMCKILGRHNHNLQFKIFWRNSYYLHVLIKADTIQFTCNIVDRHNDNLHVTLKADTITIYM